RVPALTSQDPSSSTGAAGLCDFPKRVMTGYPRARRVVPHRPASGARGHGTSRRERCGTEFDLRNFKNGPFDGVVKWTFARQAGLRACHASYSEYQVRRRETNQTVWARLEMRHWRGGDGGRARMASRASTGSRGMRRWLTVLVLLAASGFGATSTWGQSIGKGDFELTLAGAGGASLPKDNLDLETVTTVHVIPHV